MWPKFKESDDQTSVSGPYHGKRVPLPLPIATPYRITIGDRDL
jgi:hypothetical protein